jgi:arsenate reductase
MAEGILFAKAGGRFISHSAGSKPAGYVHPKSLETLKRHGIVLPAPRSKSWDEFSSKKIDIVITVCDNAAGEVCPVFFGNYLKAHWGVVDPAHFKGSDEEINAEFERVYQILERRITALLELPEITQEALKKIGSYE